MKKSKTTLFGYYLIVICNLLPVVTLAQYVIRGTVVTLGRPVSNATIVLKQKGIDKISGIQVSDSMGNFSFNAVPQENYLLFSSILNFSSDTLALVVDRNFDTIVINLNNTSNNLNAITIATQKRVFERKIDRLVFNYANSNIIVSNNAWDVLKITPMLTVSELGSIHINGVNSAIIYINDKRSYLAGEALANYLKGIPEKLIERIEIITVPSSKYDADGNAGIVNIVFKKLNQDGFQADLSGTSKQATYNTLSLNANLLYKKNKLELYSTIGVSKQKLFFDESNTSSFKNSYSIFVDSNIICRKVYPSYIYVGKIGASYNISHRQLIDVVFDISGTDLKRYTNAKSFYKNSVLDSVNVTNILNDESSSFKNLTVNYEIKIDTSKEEKLDIRFAKFWTDEAKLGSTLTTSGMNYLSDKIISDFNNSLTQKINNTSLQVDYSRILTSAINIQCGLKVGQSKTFNCSSFFNRDGNTFIMDADKSFTFSYKEFINALYASGDIKLNQHLTARLGVRMETTGAYAANKTNEYIENKYFNAFPSFFLSYSANGTSFSYSLGTRINRPSYWDLNPFNFYITDRIYLTGDPFLQPAKIFKQEITYARADRFIVQAMVSKTNSLISTEAIMNPDSTSFYYKKGNYSNLLECNINATYYGKIKKWWKYDVTLLLGYASYQGNINGFQLNQKTFAGKINLFNSIVISRSRNVFSTLSLSDIFPHYSNSTLVKNQFQVNASVRKGFSWGNLGLSFIDILGTASDRYISNYGSYAVVEKNYYDLRGVQLYASLKFGKKITKRNYNNSASNKDEQIRAK